MKEPAAPQRFNFSLLQRVFLALLIMVGAYLLSTYNYLLFHSVVEVFSIIVAFAIFVVAWNTRSYHDNDFLIFIGIAYLFVGGVDLIHTLAYSGMGVFPDYGSNLPTQLWIMGRYLESISLLLAPLFFTRKLNYKRTLAGYSLVSLLLFLSIFYWGIFPDCFVPGSGLTTFKVASEYVISGLLVAAIYFLSLYRDRFEANTFYLLISSLLLTVFAELAFTFYVSVYGISNLVGHLFKLGSFYLIYLALIKTGLKEPYRLMFREVTESKEKYQRYFEELGDAVYITKVGGEDHGRILDANTAAEEQTGYTKEELIGMNIEEDIAVGTPETIDHKTGDKRLQRGETVTLTEKKRRKDGTEYWTEVLITPVEHKGMDASLSINRDITERKRAKEQLKRYKMAIEGSDDLLAAGDEDYNYYFANSAYRSFYDVGEEEIKDYKLGDLIRGDAFEDKVKPRIDRCLQGERIEYEMERTHPTKGPRHLKINYYPLEGEEKIHGVVAVMRDITERKRAEQAINVKKEKLRNLHNAVDKLQQQENEGSILRTAVEVSEDILDFELCAVDLIEGDYLVTKAISSGLSPDQTEKYEIGEGVSGLSVEREETIWGDDLRNHPEAKPASNDFRAFISAPIGDFGVFQVVSLEVGSFDKEDVELAEILTGHLQEEIKRVRLEEDLRQQAVRDPLTDLYNRRYFNETLGEEVERCKRYDKSLAFLMADVNRFKEINDRYTHQTGDEVLKQVADQLEEKVRDADTVVRYGGDEFLVMMTQTEGGVENTTERLKEALERWNQESDLLDFPLTLAMGVSYWSPEQDRDVEEALNEADKKMYEDKAR